MRTDVSRERHPDVHRQPLHSGVLAMKLPSLRASIFLIMWACGGSTAGNVDVTDASVDKGGNGCDTVGCAYAPPCGICTAPCGCCGCPTGTRCACLEAGRNDEASDAVGEADVQTDSTTDGDAETPVGPWRKLTITNAYGPCPPNRSCTSTWSVTPDGHVESNRLGDAGASQMTPADLSALDSILTSAAFVEGMKNGFSCGPPVTDVFASFQLEIGAASLRQDVESCIFPLTPTNPPRRVNDLVTKY
jgi:hypothetical protein